MRGDFCCIEDGDIVEVRPGAAGILQTFAARTAVAPLAALIVDYGYSQPSYGDTVQAVSRTASPACSKPPAKPTLPPMSISARSCRSRRS